MNDRAITAAAMHSDAAVRLWILSTGRAHLVDEFGLELFQELQFGHNRIAKQTVRTFAKGRNIASLYQAQ
jgi:hypothetical protein